MTRTVKWFATNSKCYYGLFTCDEHGLIKGRFRVKQTEEGRYYAVRIMKHTDEKGALKIYEKQIKRESTDAGGVRQRNFQNRNNGMSEIQLTCHFNIFNIRTLIHILLQDQELPG